MSLKKFVDEFTVVNKRKPRIFISGAISNRLDTYKEFFNNAENYLVSLGANAYNPSSIDINTPWEDAMKITLGELDNCDAVYLLKGYKESKGALKELEVAVEKGYMIFLE